MCSLRPATLYPFVIASFNLNFSVQLLRINIAPTTFYLPKVFAGDIKFRMHRHTPAFCLHLVILLYKPTITATATIAITVRAAWRWPILTVTAPTIANTIVFVLPTNRTFLTMRRSFAFFACRARNLLRRL